MEKGFRLTDGPFVKGLDNALKSFGVHREQYYGGIFVGNHIHRTLQVQVPMRMIDYWFDPCMHYSLYIHA